MKKINGVYIESTERINDKVAIRSVALMRELIRNPNLVLRAISEEKYALSIDNVHIDSLGRIVILDAGFANLLERSAPQEWGVFVNDPFLYTNSSCLSLENTHCSGLSNDNCNIKNEHCS